MDKFETERQEVVEYFHDEDKRTVVAVVSVPKDIVMQEMLNVLHKASCGAFLFDGVLMQKSMLLTGVYRGKAVCHADDEFSLERGMKIARLRALRSYYKDRKRISDRVKTIYNEAARRMALAAVHNDYSLDHIEERLKEADTL